MEERETISEQLSAYLDGELSPADVLRVEQAMASDPRLAEELAALKATRELVRGLPRMRVPIDFADRVLAQAERQHLTRAAASGVPALGWLGRLAIAASLLVVATSGIIVATSMWKNVPVSAPPVSVAAIDGVERRDEKNDKGVLVKEGGGVLGLSGDNRIAAVNVRKNAVAGYREALGDWDSLRTHADKNVALDAEDLKAGREAVETFLTKRGYQFHTSTINDSETEILVLLPTTASVPKVENDLISDALVQRNTALAMVPVHHDAMALAYDAAAPVGATAAMPAAPMAAKAAVSDKMADSSLKSGGPSGSVAMKPTSDIPKPARFGKAAGTPAKSVLEDKKMADQAASIQVAAAPGAAAVEQLPAPTPTLAPAASPAPIAKPGSPAAAKGGAGGGVAVVTPAAKAEGVAQLEKKVETLAAAERSREVVTVTGKASPAAGEASRAGAVQGKDASTRDELVAASRLRAVNSDKNKLTEENRDPVYVSTPVVISTPGEEATQLNAANTYNQSAALGNTSTLNTGTGSQTLAIQSNTGRLLNDSSGTSGNGALTVVSQSQTGMTFNGGQFEQAATSQPAYNAYNGQTMVTGGTVVLSGVTTDTLAKQKELPAPANLEMAKKREASVSLGSNKLQQDGTQLQMESQRRAAEPQLQAMRITLNRRAHSDKPANVAASTFFYTTTAPTSRPADANLRQVPQASPAK